VIVEKIGIDPYKDIALIVEKDHIFVDDEVTIIAREATASSNNAPCVPWSPLPCTKLLYSCQILIMKLLHPYELLTPFELAKNNPRNALNATLLASFEAFELFF
jgi:hypothetical protein